MHALQVLPIASYYLLTSYRSNYILAYLYGILAIASLAQAIQGKSKAQTFSGERIQNISQK